MNKVHKCPALTRFVSHNHLFIPDYGILNVK